jgi:hypothetical protein
MSRTGFALVVAIVSTLIAVTETMFQLVAGTALDDWAERWATR